MNKVVALLLLFVALSAASLPTTPTGYSLWNGGAFTSSHTLLVYYPTTSQWLTTGTLPFGLDPPGLIFGATATAFTLSGLSGWSGASLTGYQGYLLDPSGNQYSGTYSGNYCCRDGGGCQLLGAFNVAFAAVSPGAPNVWAFYTQHGGGAIYYLPNIPINNVNAPDLSTSAPSAPYVLYVSNTPYPPAPVGFSAWTVGTSLVGKAVQVYYPTTNQWWNTGNMPLGLNPPSLLLAGSAQTFTMASASSWSWGSYSGYQAAFTDAGGHVYSGTYSGNYCCTNGGGCQGLGSFNVAFAPTTAGAPFVYAFYTQVGGGAVYYLPNIPINNQNAPDPSTSVPSAPYVLYVAN